ncbi:MAG TPA: 4Fe-4S binding protein [Candidatus Desulfovibrio intestinipullorum]|uniref:4Fe-4S binding protein n=1 Tax=Candidatus Desulfovibrio intestinipullorum TaxID=2838536 RepID=A0A9D1PVY5_9BACT|nr:4Fe-4S binding protein [Candidatus Desulfovibrio intestinipullorum]
MRARRWVQAGVLALLAAGLCLAAPADPAPADAALDPASASAQGPLGSLCAECLALLMSLDPLAGVLTALSAGIILPVLWGSLLVLGLSLILGRVFCGWICPMGTALDLSGGLVRALVARLRGRRSHKGQAFRGTWSASMLVLCACLTCAIAGGNLSSWTTPLPLVTKLLALVVLPAGQSLADLGLDAGALLATRMPALGDLLPLDWHIDGELRAAALWTGIVWAVLIVLECVQPRFWCRYLCPAGALQGLLARLSPVRHRLSPVCTRCGRCAAVCPMGQAPAEVDPAHCLSCRQCVVVCPQGAVHFGREAAGTVAGTMPARKTAGTTGTRSGKTAEGVLFCSKPSCSKPSCSKSSRRPPFCSNLSRRKLFCAAGAGATVALLGRLPGQSGLFPATTSFVRPPAALPEEDFLRLCLRCGACMQICPGKALQPLLFQAGGVGFHSPVLVPRLGACRPDCTLCGTVCPTGALKKLSLLEKRWAKMGTAVVNRTLCLAFAEGRRCMVCKENCPYGAVDVVAREGVPVAVPVVQANRCYGCGFCEKACPKTPAAIAVSAEGALRLNSGDYQARARSLGLELDPEQHKRKQAGPPASWNGAPPGFLE